MKAIHNWFDVEIGGSMSRAILSNIMIASYANPDYRFVFGVDGYGWGLSKSSFDRLQIKMTNDSARPFQLLKEYYGDEHSVGSRHFEGDTKITGTLDAPGVLCAGRVVAEGPIDGTSWGAKPCTCARPNNETGKYRIIHNIGHTQYYVTAILNGGTTGAVAVVNRQANYCDLVVRALDANQYNVPFDFMICGQN